MALLAVLGGVVWWSNKKQAAEPAKRGDKTVKMLTIPEDQFQEIRVKKGRARLIVLQKQRRRQVGDHASRSRCRRTRTRSASMVSTLSSLNADKLIEEKAADLRRTA